MTVPSHETPPPPLAAALAAAPPEEPLSRPETAERTTRPTPTWCRVWVYYNAFLSKWERCGQNKSIKHIKTRQAIVYLNNKNIHQEEDDVHK